MGFNSGFKGLMCVYFVSKYMCTKLITLNYKFYAFIRTTDILLD